MRPTTRMFVAASLLILVGTSLPSTALGAVQTRPNIDPSGHWEGLVQTPDTQIKIEIDLARSGGDLIGTFGQPDEGVRGLLLTGFSTEGDSLRFQIKGKAGERAFDGKLSPDGKSMTGGFNTQGYSLPFALTRTGDARIEAPAKNAPIAKEFEGTWNGTIMTREGELRLVLTFANQADGTGAASLVNLTEGLEIPVSAVTQAASDLTLDLKAIGGSYIASLNKEGTELVGTFSEKGQSAPMTFQRAVK